MKHLRKNTIRSLGFYLGILGLWSSPALAAVGDHALGFQVGQVWPSGEIGRERDGSVAPGLFYEYTASEVFSVYASGVTSSHNSGALKLKSATVGMKAHLVYYDKLAPYAMVGAGLYSVKRLVGSRTIETASTTNFGFHLGLGAELDLSERFFLGLQFDIHNLFAAYDQLVVNGRTENSGRWTGFFLRGGVRF